VPATRLVIVGGDDPKHPGTMDLLRSHADALGVADSVSLLGYRDDAQTLLAGADVALVTSREGFGLVAVEALMLGVPVVGVAVGATPRHRRPPASHRRQRRQPERRASAPRLRPGGRR